MKKILKLNKKMAIPIVALALLIPIALATIGGSKTSFVPTPNGNGRAVAFNGTHLFYTIQGDANIYVANTSGASFGAIPNPGRTFTCGALSYDGTMLWCGTYDGTGSGGPGSADIWTINPTTGAAALAFNTIDFGGLAADNCFGQPTGYMDGLAYDNSDNTICLSDDGGRTIYHVTTAGALLNSFSTPNHPNTASPGCNSGIEVAPGGYLELTLLSVGGQGDGTDYIVKVPKSNPSGSIIVSFPVNNIEDIAFDAKTFAPRCALWTNLATFGSNVLEAFDVQCTRTIGYWKNHPAADYDATSFLPINLGDDDSNGYCEVVATQGDVEDILKGHKGQNMEAKLYAQLLAAKLNVAMGDIPAADLAAITTVINDADDLLGKNACNPDTGKKGADRAEAQTLHSLLDAFNNKYSP
jgi:hypothetical protein